jgi:mono/diheme cytochrome c family protein
MNMRTILLSIAILIILVQIADAGPANRRASSATGAQVSVPINLNGFGAPLPGIAQNQADLSVFATGQIDFKEVESLPQIGPVMNGVSCAGCHSQPAIGGGGLFINEIRVRNNTQPGPVHIFAVDNFLRNGPQTQGGAAIFPRGVEAEPLGCQITAPGCQPSACQQEEEAHTTFSWNLGTCDPTSADFQSGGNCVVGRSAVATFGDGLVEAVSDQTFQQIARDEPRQIRGIVKMVTENFTHVAHVGRFGWKDDHSSLRGFSGDAYLNEMGITNPDNQDEVSQCAINETAYGMQLQDTGVEDTTGPDGRADIDRFSDFMRGLAPPPSLPENGSAQNGAKLFAAMGCAGCHVESMTTASNPSSFIATTTGGAPISQTLNATLANKTFHPYSDFLLHDMGSLGDGIASGIAGPTMMRTAPLWGLRAKSQLLHDGRAGDIPTAIKLHDGQGKLAAQAFDALSAQQQLDVVNFLNTL